MQQRLSLFSLVLAVALSGPGLSTPSRTQFG